VRDFAAGVMSVGAGYTTVMASGGGSALVDFGAPRGRVALEALIRLTDHQHHRHSHWWPWWHWWPGPEFDQLVISHPHADHYSGLLRLAGTPPSQRQFPELVRPGGTLLYPRVPRTPDAQRVVYFLARLNEVISALPENALGRAVVATSSGPIGGVPLKRGDEIELAGVPVDVLWPPEYLDERSGARLRNLVREYELIAEEAAERGNDRLIRAADAVRESTEDLRLNELLYAVPEEASDAPSIEVDDDFSDESAEQGYRRFDDPAFEARLRQVRRSISRGANLMSLVFATRPQRYVFLGDLDQSLHPDIVPDLVDQEHELILSAHHGTHLSPELLRLQSRFVVSSVGPPRLDSKVRSEYASIGTHLRTDTAGDVLMWMHDSGVHLATCNSPG